jgi:CRP-like cAMP-binding protein
VFLPVEIGTMTLPVQDITRNGLLRAMSAADFDLLAPDLVFTKLNRGFVVAEPNETIAFVYFFESGVSSTIAISPENFEVEVGLAGYEGCAPLEPILGLDRSINRIVLQLADDSWRIGSEQLQQHIAARPTLRLLLNSYAQITTLQAQYTALSNAIHQMDERLARWLLMCDDRVEGGKLEITHDFLSVMLAVRRPSVTTALHALEGHGFIRSERGCVIIRDRRGLEEFARDAYGRPEAEYRRLIGPFGHGPLATLERSAG